MVVIIISDLRDFRDGCDDDTDTNLDTNSDQKLEIGTPVSSILHCYHDLLTSEDTQGGDDLPGW